MYIFHAALKNTRNLWRPPGSFYGIDTSKGRYCLHFGRESDALEL